MRDVARAHALAATLPRETVAGKRYILTNAEGCLNTVELSAIAQRCFPQYRMDAPPKYPPLALAVARALSYVPVVGALAMTEFERLGMETHVRLDSGAATRELGVVFRPLEETVRDGVAAMIDGGFVKPRPREP